MNRPYLVVFRSVVALLIVSDHLGRRSIQLYLITHLLDKLSLFFQFRPEEINLFLLLRHFLLLLPKCPVLLKKLV